ncbi:MAG: ComF family protein [Nitrospirae bacterium]|nr:ComF family protein [Nitrospirota bacterium]
MEKTATGFHWQSLLSLILPARCHACRRYLRDEASPCFCRDCWDTVSLIDGPCCPCCGKPFASEAALSHSPGHLCGDCRERSPYFDRAVAAGWYEGVLAEAIHLFKYRGKTVLARPLGALLLHAMERLPKADGLVPVPLHPSRLREREFNQALLLCDSVKAESGLPVIPDGLERVRETPPQIGLSHEDRRRNVRRAFVPKRPERIEGRRIVLIDDVLTTGATVNDCARALKRAGAERVCVLTVARTPDGFG